MPHPTKFESTLGSLRPERIVPVPDPDAIENLKFSEALPPALADEVFCSRSDNPTAIRTTTGRADSHDHRPAPRKPAVVD